MAAAVAAVCLSVALTPMQDGEFRPDPPTLVDASHSPLTGTDAHPWESMIQIYFQPQDWEWARDVIGCETGYTYNEHAYNPASGAAGLFQFIPSTWEFSKPWPDASPYDPTAAFMAARWLHDNLGKSQWACTALTGH